MSTFLPSLNYDSGNIYDQDVPLSPDCESPKTRSQSKGLDVLFGMNLSSHIALINHSEEETALVLENKSFALSRSFEDDEFENIDGDDDEKVFPNLTVFDQLQKMNVQSSSTVEMIDDFSREIRHFQNEYELRKRNCNEIGSFQGTILSFLEYVNVNHDNFIDALHKYNLPPEECDLIDQNLDQLETNYKWIDCVAPLILNGVRIWISFEVQKEFDILQARFEELKNETASPNDQEKCSISEKVGNIQNCMEQLQNQITEDREEAKTKGCSKIIKIANRISVILIEKISKIAHKRANKVGKHTLSIFIDIKKIFDVRKALSTQKRWIFHLQSRIVVNINCPVSPTSQEQLLNEAKILLNSLAECTKIEEVKQRYKEVGIPIEVPSNFDDWRKQFKDKRFRRHLVQCFYCSKGTMPVMDANTVNAILRRRKVERNDKIDQSLTFIEQHIKECQGLELPEITAHFKSLHIHLDQVNIPQNNTLKLPPQTKTEWDQCTQNKEFCVSLATQWVDYQETTWQLVMQAARQFLLSKNSVERKFLYFRGFEYVATVASSIIQLLLCLPNAKLSMATSILELFVSDVAKIGVPGLGLIYVFYPLYPDMTLKIDNIILMIAEHFFAIKYKPNEYSFEGYKLMFQIQWFSLVSIAHYFISLSEQTLLWLNMRLIENCIMGHIKQSIEDDSRYIQINEKYEQHRINCKQNIIELQKCLYKLEIKDSKLCIHPHMQHAGPNNEEFDPIQNFVQSLEDVNFDYFPPEVHDFFEINFGFKLSENNKKGLQEKLEDFFSESEDELIKTYQTNTANYLKV